MLLLTSVLMLSMHFKVRPPYYQIFLIGVDIFISCLPILGVQMQFSLLIFILCTCQAYGVPFEFLFKLAYKILLDYGGSVRCS